MRKFAVATFVLSTFAGMAAGAEFETQGAPTWTTVSGFTAATVVPVTSSAGEALRAIRWIEAQDRPISFRATFYKLSNTEPAAGETERPMCVDAHCAGGLTETERSATVGAYRYVTKVQVCTNPDHNSNETARLKGIRLWGARLNADGSLSAIGGAHEAKRTNCTSWRAARSCPAGQVAVGLRGYHDSSGSFKGIELQCAPMKLRR